MIGARSAAAAPDLSRLSPEHQREIIEESANRPDVVAARGWWTALRLSEVPEVFPRWQRRIGLIGPWYSPDGETVSYQQKAKKRRTLKSGKLAPKYESPHGARQIVDVHPLMREAIKNVRVPLWVTEGLKTGDSLTSQGRCTVVLAGVWNFAVAGTESKILLPCWDHIPLRGRTVFAVYDSDARANPDVQEALARLVARLEERGARVLVIYPPPVNEDGKAGVDDYLAAGGDLDDLERSARPFEPIDVRAERLSRDERLRSEIEALWVAWESMPTVTLGQCTNRSTMRELIRVAEERGKQDKGGITVQVPTRTLAQALGISDVSVGKALKRLEQISYLRPSTRRRKRREAQSYTLLTYPWCGGRALSSHKGRMGSHEGRGDEGREDSFQHRKGTDHPCANPARGGDLVPELRASKVVHRWERAESPNGSQSRWRIIDSDVIARLGKRRGEILRYLVKVGGSASIPDLIERFGTAAQKERPRDFKRRQLAPLQGFRPQKTKKMQRVDEETWEEVEVDRIDLGPPIIEVDGDIVRLMPKWRENLEQVRTVAQEQEDAKLQADKYARQRERFHSLKKAAAEPTPKMPEPETVRRIVRASAERDEAARTEEQHREVGVTAENFIKGKLRELERVRLNLLREVWRDEGGDPSHILSAAYHLGCSIERLPAYGNELFVFPARAKQAEGADRETPATVIDLPVRQKSAEVAEAEPTAVELPKKVNGVFVHGALCECDWCEDDPPPRYARLGGRARVKETA